MVRKPFMQDGETILGGTKIQASLTRKALLLHLVSTHKHLKKMV